MLLITIINHINLNILLIFGLFLRNDYKLYIGLYFELYYKLFIELYYKLYYELYRCNQTIINFINSQIFLEFYYRLY